MGLDLWFPEDISRILSGHARPAMRLDHGPYREGYLDALRDIATSCGVDICTIQAALPAGNGRPQIIIYQE